MGKSLPTLAVCLQGLLCLTGCVSRGESGPTFPENQNPVMQPEMAPTSAPGPSAPGMAPKTGAWESFKSTMTDNPVTRGFRSAGQKTASAVTPTPRQVEAPDPVSLSTPTPKPNPAMFVSMAQVQSDAGHLEAAAELYEKALRMSKGKAQVPALVGLGQVRFRQQQHDAGLKLFDKARQLDPKSEAAILGQAHFHDTRENMPEATKLYREATRLNPQSATAWNDLGLCLARQRQLGEAQLALQKAVQLDEANILFRNNLATVLVEMNQRDEALVQLTHAHGPAIAHYNLGFLLHRRGEDQAAVQEFNRALQYDPNFEPARTWLQQLEGRDGGGPQRAARPQQGRSAALLRGPDGHTLPLVAKSQRATNGMPTPPEFDHLAIDGPAEIVEVPQDEEPEMQELPQPIRSPQQPIQHVAHDQDLSPEQVLPAEAIEISDDSVSNSQQLPATEQSTESEATSQLPGTDEAESLEPIAEEAPTPAESALLEPVAAEKVELVQPELVTGPAAGHDEAAAEPVSPAPRIPQLQAVDENERELASPPLPE